MSLPAAPVRPTVAKPMARARASALNTLELLPDVDSPTATSCARPRPAICRSKIASNPKSLPQAVRAAKAGFENVERLDERGAQRLTRSLEDQAMLVQFRQQQRLRVWDEGHDRWMILQHTGLPGEFAA